MFEPEQRNSQDFTWKLKILNWIFNVLSVTSNTCANNSENEITEKNPIAIFAIGLGDYKTNCRVCQVTRWRFCSQNQNILYLITRFWQYYIGKD